MPSSAQRSLRRTSYVSAHSQATLSLRALMGTRRVHSGFVRSGGLLRADAGPHSGDRKKKMAEHRRIWPLLVYGGLAAIAALRRKDPEQGTARRGAVAHSLGRV